MQQLISRLTDPNANMTMRQAARALLQTSQLAENDRTGRIRAENICRALQDEVINLRSSITLEEAQKIYMEAVNYEQSHL